MDKNSTERADNWSESVQDEQSKGSNSKLDTKLKPLEYDLNMSIAYLLRKFPESYNIAMRLFNEIQLRYPSFSPKHLMDFGSGPSPSGWAFKASFPKSSGVIAVEPNKEMTDLGQRLALDDGFFNFAGSL